MAARVPDVSRRMLAHVPRLEGVAQILTHHRRDADGRDGRGGVPIGARILRIALDHDDLRTDGLCDEHAIEVMRARDGAYDAQLLEAFARTLRVSSGPVREVPIAAVQPGMRLAADLRAPGGELLAARGALATPALVERLRNGSATGGRERVQVDEPEAGR
jgi:hypothetical protein